MIDENKFVEISWYVPSDDVLFENLYTVYTDGTVIRTEIMKLFEILYITVDPEVLSNEEYSPLAAKMIILYSSLDRNTFILIESGNDPSDQLSCINLSIGCSSVAAPEIVKLLEKMHGKLVKNKIYYFEKNRFSINSEPQLIRVIGVYQSEKYELQQNGKLKRIN